MHLVSRQRVMCYFYFSRKILLMVLAIFVTHSHTNRSLEALGINCNRIYTFNNSD